MSWIKEVTSSPILQGCLKKLAEEGKMDLARFSMLTPMEVVDLCGVEEAVAEGALRRARELSGYTPIRRLGAVQTDVIRTGIQEFDEKTPWGGLPKYKIHLFAGRYGAGKSILAMQVAFAALSQGYGPAVYIDTENAFNDKMANALSRRFLGKPLAEVLDVQLIVMQTVDVFALTEVLKFHVPPEARVIIVDSIIEPFRAQFKGRDKLAPRQQWLHYLVDLLRRRTMAGATVVVTNQVMAKPDLFGEEDVPAGGNVLLHTANTIWRIRPKKVGKQQGGQIEALDVPGLARGTAYSFVIEDDGLH